MNTIHLWNPQLAQNRKAYWHDHQLLEKIQPNSAFGNATEASKSGMLHPGLLDLTLAKTATSLLNKNLQRSFFTGCPLRNVETNSPAFAPVVFNPPATRGRRRPMIGNIVLKDRTRKRDTPSEAMRELDEKIQELEAVAEVDEAPGTRQEPFYTEHDLAGFYQDVLANPSEDEPQLRTNEKAMRDARNTEDALLVRDIYERFDVSGGSSSSRVDNIASTRPVQVILSRMESIIERLEAAQRLTVSEDPNEEQLNFPVSILTMRECEALVRFSTRAQDAHSAELTLQLMKRTGLPIPEAALTNVLQLYAKLGDRAAADRFVATFFTEPLTEDQRHLHIRAHLKSVPSTLIPISALDLLHSYENQSQPAPMETYALTISTLFHLPSSIARGQAWDLFSHMRYVAHPDPDIPLYTLMIRACAYPLKSTLSSEPEKALDLWTEMTVDHGLTPSVASYNAVILACARAGTKEFVGEAFRLARQMLDSHRDAHGESAYRPDRNTFCALLEGAKRLGDLSRVRWILAEMTRQKEGEDEANSPTNAEVDETIMLHVFNAYAAYKPPFIRAQTVIIESPIAKARGEAKSVGTAIASKPSSDKSFANNISLEDDTTPPTFAHIPPQTHNEVMQEVKFLFQSICDAQSPSDSDASFANDKFRNVQVTPRLITAYLSVFYSHSSLHAARDLFWSLYETLGMQRTARAYIEAFERCANARKTRDGGHERDLALKFADELWKDWIEIEASAVQPNGTKLEARSIERANVAIIRVLTMTNQVDRALETVRAFVERYPPRAVRDPPPKPMLRSTKMVLGGAKRPLVRMTAPMEVPDDYVPPILMFKDLEALHHKLVAYRRAKDIGYLKWVSKAYEWALRVRKDETARFVPEDKPKAAG